MLWIESETYFQIFNLTSCSVSLTGTVTKTRKKEFLRRYVQCLPISIPIAQFQLLLFQYSGKPGVLWLSLLMEEVYPLGHSCSESTDVTRYDVNRFDLTCLSEECLTGTKMHGSQTVAISILDLSIFMQPALERSHAESLNLLRLKLEARTRSNIQNGGRGSRIFITLELSYITSWKDTLTFLA